jgi:hypothetical protein
VVKPVDIAMTEFRANVFNAIPGAIVEWRTEGGDWVSMTKTENETDPTFQALYNEEQTYLPGKPAWRTLAKPLVCPHLWKANLTESMKPGTHLIQVRATNPNGQVLNGERIVRVE